MPRPIPEYMKIRTFVYKLALSTQSSAVKLPSENELCSLFGVSRITVREALQTLVQNKIILSRKGMGTFVHPDFSSQCLSPWCIGYLRFSGQCATNQLSGAFADCIETLGLSYELLFHTPSAQGDRQLLASISSLSGVVWEGYTDQNASLAEKLAATGIPLLLVSPTRTPYDTLLLDSHQEGELIARIAAAHGHKDILFLTPWHHQFLSDFMQANQTYPETYRHLRPSGDIPTDNYCTLAQLKELIKQPTFRRRFSMIYSRRDYVRSVMDMLSEQGLQVPEDMSYLVFETSTPMLFQGRRPSVINPQKSLMTNLMDWLSRRIIQGDKSGTFFARRTVEYVPGETVRNLLA